MKRIYPILLLSALVVTLFLSGCPSPFGYYTAGNEYLDRVYTQSESSYQVVATPTFLSAPAAGGSPVIVSGSPTEDVDQPVTITTAEPSAFIYYTTDGSTPKPNGATTKLFDPTKPISVAGNNTTVTIKSVAFKALMLPSAVVTLTMQISYASASTPAFDHAAGIYNGSFTVQITDSTPGATIWYTIDGSAPTVGGSLSGNSPVSVSVSSSMTVQALASAPGRTDSSPVSALYTLQPLSPAFSLPGGSYSAVQTVTITAPTAGSVVWYTLNGSTPIPGSSAGGVASVNITVDVSRTIKAVTSASGWTDSAIITRNYTLVVPAPTITGTLPYMALSDSLPGATIWYTVDGSQPIANQPPAVSTPLSLYVGSTETIRAIAVYPGWSDSQELRASYQVSSGSLDFQTLSFTTTKSLVDDLASTTPIDNSDGNLVPVGQVILFKTHGGIYGKMVVTDNTTVTNNGWAIHAITYDAAGNVVNDASTQIRGTWLCDLANIVETSTIAVADFQLRNQTSTVRDLLPYNGAIFLSGGISTSL